MRVEEIEKLLNDDKEFKRWSINKLIQLDSKLIQLEQEISNINNTFKIIKRLIYVVTTIVLAKFGIDINHLI